MSISPTTDKGEISLHIEKCGLFSEDPKFTGIKDSVPHNWLNKKYECTDDDALSANMDNVTFHNDIFELLVNMKGFSPEEIRCNVTTHKIELIAQQQGKAERGTCGLIQRNRSMNRTYELPQNINPNEAMCFLSADCILVVIAPWLK